MTKTKKHSSVSELLQMGNIGRYQNRGIWERGKETDISILLAAVITRWQGESAATLRLRSKEDMRSR